MLTILHLSYNILDILCSKKHRSLLAVLSAVIRAALRLTFEVVLLSVAYKNDHLSMSRPFLALAEIMKNLRWLILSQAATGVLTQDQLVLGSPHDLMSVWLLAPLPGVVPAAVVPAPAAGLLGLVELSWLDIAY